MSERGGEFERAVELRADAADSASRLRAALPRAEVRPRSLANVLLAPHDKALRALARRCRLADPAGFANLWLQHCAKSVQLAQEHPEYIAPIRRAAGPLLESLSQGGVDLSELHVVELFVDLRELALSPTSLLHVADGLEHALGTRTADEGQREALSAFGRFLTCLALEPASANRDEPVISESSERLRLSGSGQGGATASLVGESQAMGQLRSTLQDLAHAPGTVLIVGESGTGKELVAKALHLASAPRGQPFVAVNCAALPRELIESELFGHERGAFTGSREGALGLMRSARRGTLFLDEVTEMPAELQPKLLRALEQRMVRPVGGLRELPFHARVLAATNADPQDRKRWAALRPDLFYRLCVHRIDVPPLRARKEDIPILIEHFSRRLAQRGHRTPLGFADECLQLLSSYAWPGNVRELRNVVEHCCATAKGGVVRRPHLPAAIGRPSAFSGSAWPERVSEPPSQDELTLRQVERVHVERVLKEARWNKSRAARALGLSRHQLYLKLERLEIRIRDEDSEP